MKKITTVRGDINPNELGFTSMHEHTLCDARLIKDAQLAMFPPGFLPPIPPEKLAFKPENFAFFRTGLMHFSEEQDLVDDVDYMIKEVNAFKAVGGNSLCDCSPVGVRGNLHDIKKVSEATGVNIVHGSGIYLVAGRPPEFKERSEEFLTSYFEKEVSEGMDGTGIKPGFLKCALGTMSPDGTAEENELTAFKALAKIAAENGMSLHLHATGPLPCDEIIAAIDIVLDECGIKPDRLLVCHTDSALSSEYSVFSYMTDFDYKKDVNTDYQEKLLDRGINIGYDSWGFQYTGPTIYLPDDYDKVKGLVHLLNKGYASQIVLGHDVAGKFWGLYNGSYGFTRFPEFVLPLLQMFGFEDAINKLTVENPARILAY